MPQNSEEPKMSVGEQSEG